MVGDACYITKTLTKFRILKDFKRIIKIQELPPFGKFATEVLIFRSSRSQMFFKIGVLKNFATFTGKHLCWSLQSFFYRTPTVAASRFSWQLILFFQLNLVFFADSCTGFCSRLLWKHKLKPQKQPLELFKKRCSKKFC